MAHVITLNAGSSSIKFALFERNGSEPFALCAGLVEDQDKTRHLKVKDAAGTTLHEATWEGGAEVAGFHTDALRRVLAWRQSAFPDAQVVAAGHRVVHGGLRFAEPVIVTDEVMSYLKSLIRLAPLHQPHNIAGIAAAQEAWPHIPQVACFDTSFHRSHAFENDTFALPRALYDEGVRRYGFHGLSYEYICGKLAEIAPMHAAGRVVVAHLGNGASMCAISNGRSVASSMGFTALDGLPMGTRCGQLDPGVLLYLMQEKGMSAQQISDLLYQESGLKGLSNLSNDMRELLAAGTKEADEAVAYFVFRIRRELGGLAAALKGLDAIVFCGGIGENAGQVRERVLEGMEWIGVELDRAANRDSRLVISTERSRVRVFVIPTNEEAMIARHALETIGTAGQLAVAS